MKKSLSSPLFWLFPGAGLAAMGLQFWYLGTATDQKDLLTPWHPGSILTWVLAALVAAAALWAASRAASPRKDEVPPVLPFAGDLCLTAGLAFTACAMVFGSHPVVFRVAGVLAAAGAVSAGLMAWRHIKGEDAHYLAYAAIGVFLISFLMAHYQTWSAEPEITRYCVTLLSVICVMLCVYHMAALAFGIGKYRTFRLLQQLAVFGCFASVPTADQPVLMAAMGLWLTIAGLSFVPARKRRGRQQPAGEETP